MKQKIIDIIFDGKIVLPMKYINMFCYYILPIFALSYVLVPYLLGMDMYYKNAVSLGSLAFFTLLAILFIKPLTQIFFDIRIFSKILILRKQLGVLMFWLYIAHATGAVLSIGIGDIILLNQTFGLKSYLLWGIFTGIIIFFLGITSNMLSMKLLKKNWKRLHKLVYVALVFVALHIYFIAGDISPFLIVIFYGIFKFVAYKNIKIPVKKYII